MNVDYVWLVIYLDVESQDKVKWGARLALTGLA